MASAMPTAMNGPTSAKVLLKSDPSPMPLLARTRFLFQSILWNTPPPLVSKVRRIQFPRTTLDSRSLKALREAVAKLYNHTYRQGKASQYTYENVCIVPGGRAGLSRVAAVIGDVYCVCNTPWGEGPLLINPQSYQIPDYTAYDQVLSAFKRLVPVPTA
jgi:hypothetical protein